MQYGNGCGVEMNFFKKERLTIEERKKERRQLLKPFLNKYKNPIIVHSLDNKASFKKILEERKIKIPKKHSFPKKCPYMEKFLKIDNSIYYSLGFVYKTAYDWKYNLIFDIGYIKELKYYCSPIIYNCYREIAKYWYDNDRDYLMKLKNKNKRTWEVIDRFLNKPYKGKKRSILDFWKIEKEIFEHIQDYKDKKELRKIIKKVDKELRIKYPNSKKEIKKAIKKDKIPEIIGEKDNNLIKNPYFLGFYIDGKIPLDILKLLKKKYPDKILFDGNKIKEIKDLK